MINGIGGLDGFMYLSQMGNPFQKIDSNGDGSLDKTEISSFADKISEKTGQSLDADQLFSKLDTNGDDLISQEEFDAGRPEGPPPGMMGGMQADSIRDFLGMLNSTEEDEDSSSWVDPLDINGDGIVDAEELKLAISSLVQKYTGQMTSASDQDNGESSLLNLQV